MFSEVEHTRAQGHSNPVKSDENDRNRERLIRLLQMAYSGELAAAHAYRGHWKSVRNADERRKIKSIEEEELQHRAWVGEMLAELGNGPSPEREAKMGRIGRTIGFLCRISGWLIPMYGAGRLESTNIKEYEDAALYAAGCGCASFVPRLIQMAEVEWDHEFYFRTKVLSHFLGRRIPLWTLPPPKDGIRKRLETIIPISD